MDQDEFGQFQTNNFSKYNDLKKVLNENGDLNYYKATLNQNSQLLKVRIYPYNKLLEPEIEFINQIQQYYQEFEQSPNQQDNQCNFAKIYEQFEEEDQQYIVFENSGKDLQTEIKNNIQYYQDTYKIQICKDITRAVQFLHKKETIARTLKPQDFVRIGQTFKLINFSYIRDSFQFGRNKGQKPNEYSAPEFFYKKQKNYYELDIWSLGMIFYEIFQGNPLIEQQKLYELNDIQLQEYIQNTLNKLQIRIDIKQLLIEMLNFDRNKRPKIDEILKRLEIFNKPAQFFIQSFNSNQETKDILKLEKIDFNTDSKTYKTQIQNHIVYKDIIIRFLSENNQVEKEFLNQLFQDCNHHPYMMKIFEKFDWNDQQVIVTEFGLQDLLTYLQQNNNLSLDKRKDICLNITQQIYYLHNKNYVYGDLRIENIYLTYSTFKIIGFEKIRKLNQQQLEQISLIEPNLYQSPELIENNNIIIKGSDIWSLGCIWYEIFSGQTLFDGQNIQEVQQKILNHKINQEPIYNKIDSLEITQDMKEIIKLMLHPNYEQRIDVVNLLKMLQKTQPNQFPFNNKNCLVEKIFQNAQQILPIYQQIPADKLIQNIQSYMQKFVGNESIEKIKNWNKIYQKLCQYIQEITKELNKQIQEKNKNLLYFQYPKSILAFNQFPKMLNFCQQGFIKNNI